MAERTAIVTGASRGIGLGIAGELAAKGFGLTIAARDKARLEEAARVLRDLGAAEIVVCPGDLADPDQPTRLAAEHQVAFGAVDCLVLNAGVGTAGPIVDLPAHRFDKIVAVNLRAPHALLQAALPGLRTAAAKHPDHGVRITALSSITGVYAERGLAVYGATKAALIALVASINAEESANGVTATAISPGYVDTDMSAWVAEQIPPERMIPVDDVARLAGALVDLSARTVVPHLVLSRAGTSGYVA
jgi:3-oxoacyl-[acyl-carrier protein] reductase